MAAKADVNQVVRHKSLICAAENPVLQDFQPITVRRAVIEYALIIINYGGDDMKFAKLASAVTFSVLIGVFSAFRTDAVSIDVSAKGCVLMEAETGEIIYGKNENLKLPMASTTKIMTTLLVLESGGLDDEFTVDSSAIMVEGSSMGLTEGDIVTKRALCYGMMLPSGNDAANASAVKLAGSYEEFAKLMNRRAKLIGMENTSFVTPSGLHDDNHWSTAYDMALLTSEALDNEDFRNICCCRNAHLKFGNPPYNRWLRNTNKLLTFYSDCIGVKTGFTDEAGRCLVSAAERDGVTLICVTLNDPSDWSDHIKLFDYGFDKVTKYPLNMGNIPNEIDIVGGNKDSCALSLDDVPYCGFTEDKRSEITVKTDISGFIYAPVRKGDRIGTARYYYNDREVASADICAAEDIDAVVIEREKGIYEYVIDFVKKILLK